MKNKYIFLSALAIAIASCEPKFENELDAQYTKGDADFSSYVAIGNSLTAGYMDGTVSRGGQANSYPSILASGFSKVGGGAFTQPSYADDVNNLGGIAGLTATRLVIDASQGRPENIVGTPTITLTPQAKAFNNMGVPGAKIFHLLAPGYGNIAGVATGQANPYFVRHATTPSATVMADAMTKSPTFFTNWIGNNDILSYATSGGTQPDNPTTSADESLNPATDNNASGNVNPATYGSNDITNNGVFANVYTSLINTLTTNANTKGVVCTIPSVTSIPYFTRVPFNALPSEATATNATAIGLYQFLAAVTSGRIAPLNTAPGTKNPVLMRDDDLTDIGTMISAAASTQPSLAPFATALGQLYGKARHATANDLIVLPASGIIGQVNPMGSAPFNVNGVTLPLANKFVLSANEKAKVASATAAYNSAIISIANAKNTAAGKTVVAVADMNAILNQLVSGLRVESGVIYTANYFNSSATESRVLFSLDGVHPNARGYAVIANEITKVINRSFKANIPLVNASYYPGISIVATN